MGIDLHHEILKSMRAAPAIVRGLVRDLGSEQVRRRPRPTEWAVIEIVAHMADTDERALGRLRRMLREDKPPLPGFDQEQLARDRRYIDMDVTEQLDRYERGRIQHVNELTALDEAEWQRIGVHSEHGPMSVEHYEAHVASEDVDHLAQIARLVLGSERHVAG